jgi:CBS domain-containing protein
MSARAAWRLESLGFNRVYRYVAGKMDWLAAGLPSEGPEAATPRAGDVAIRDAPTCSLDERVGAVRGRLQDSGWTSCIVVNAEGVVLGRLRRAALEGELAGDAQETAEAVMEPGPTTVRPSEPLADLVKRMQEHRVGTIVVTTPEGVLVGVLRREDGEKRLSEEKV